MNIHHIYISVGLGELFFKADLKMVITKLSALSQHANLYHWPEHSFQKMCLDKHRLEGAKEPIAN